MSLVGTRPILQDELQKYELHHRARIAIKPGIQDACDYPEKVMKLKQQAADFVCKKYNWDEVVRHLLKHMLKKLVFASPWHFGW